MNTFGNNFRITLFGESHGKLIGCTAEGFPAGFAPELEACAFELKRRAPHGGSESTQRRESDEFEIASGMYKGAFTGAPLTVLFRNRDAQSGDYARRVLRPSHADLTAHIKYRGANDPRGGGMFSGRMTLPLVFIGAVCRQLLKRRNIAVASHILNIGGIEDGRFDPMMKAFPPLDPFFPLIHPEKRDEIEALFASLRESGNSVGASAECAALGVPAGLGEPFFNGLESMIAHILFAVPGVHAVEFGAGSDFSRMLGSEANDPVNGDLTTGANNSGGINGGISNGMPITVRAAFRPVPSIYMPQKSVDIESGEAAELNLTGRHDRCILPRGCSAVEAAVMIALYDALLSFEVYDERQ